MKDRMISVQIKEDLLHRLVEVAKEDKQVTGNMVTRVLEKWCDMKERLNQERKEGIVLETTVEVVDESSANLEEINNLKRLINCYQAAFSLVFTAIADNFGSVDLKDTKVVKARIHAVVTAMFDSAEFLDKAEKSLPEGEEK